MLQNASNSDWYIFITTPNITSVKVSLTLVVALHMCTRNYIGCFRSNFHEFIISTFKMAMCPHYGLTEVRIDKIPWNDTCTMFLAHTCTVHVKTTKHILYMIMYGTHELAIRNRH